MNFISSEIFIVEFFQFDTSLGITEKRLEKLKFGTIARDFWRINMAKKLHKFFVVMRDNRFCG